MKRERIVKAIRLTWDSLNSHLDSAMGVEEKNACCQEAVGNAVFHRKCVKEYAFIIDVLTEQL